MGQTSPFSKSRGLYTLWQTHADDGARHVDGSGLHQDAGNTALLDEIGPRIEVGGTLFVTRGGDGPPLSSFSVQTSSWQLVMYLKRVVGHICALARSAQRVSAASCQYTAVPCLRVRGEGTRVRLHGGDWSN